MTTLPRPFCPSLIGSARQSMSMSSPVAWRRLATMGCLLISTLACATDAPRLQLQPAQLKAMGVVVQAVDARNVSLGPYAGTVSLPPSRLRLVTAPWAGLVSVLHVSEGDAVRAGQVLVTLDSPGGVEQANAARAARAQIDLSRQVLLRDEALFKEGLIPRARLDAAMAQVRQDELLMQSRQAAAAMPGTRWVGGKLQLLAPMDGVVLGKTATLGDRVEAGAPLVHIGQAGHWWVDMRIPVADAVAVRQGQAVGLQAGAQAHQASVSAVGLAVDAASQTVMVRAQVTGQRDAPLRWGQAVEARILTGAVGTVGVPDTAIVEWQGQPAVWVEEAPGKLRLQPVPLAERRGALSTVRGVPAQSRVVVQGAAALKAALDARP
jgi:cobalt-zinc-cadmium efflux system membrane fusion protein